MTTFNTDVPGAQPTSFVQPGAEGNKPADEPVQGDVVLEIEGRKFTKDSAFRKIVSQDEHIARLEAEREQQRTALAAATAALEKAVSTAEVLKRVQEGAGTGAPAAGQPVDVASVVAAVKADITADATKAQQEANFAACASDLSKVHGAAADKRVRAVAAELGMTFEEAVKVAKSSPAAFRKWFPELNKQQTKLVPTPASSFSTNPQPTPRADNAALNRWMSAKNESDRMTAYIDRLNELAA